MPVRSCSDIVHASKCGDFRVILTGSVDSSLHNQTEFSQNFRPSLHLWAQILQTFWVWQVILMNGPLYFHQYTESVHINIKSVFSVFLPVVPQPLLRDIFRPTSPPTVDTENGNGPTASVEIHIFSRAILSDRMILVFFFYSSASSSSCRSGRVFPQRLKKA